MVLTALTLCVENIVAEDVSMCNMHYVQREDGLAGLSANKALTDHLGRVWIATSGGVSFFNGIRSTLIPMIESKDGVEGHVSRQIVFDLCESPSSHTLYAATGDDVWQLDESNDFFTLLFADIPLCRLLCDARSLYIGNPQGLRRYSDGQLTEIDIKGDRDVHCMAFGPDSTIWFLTTDVLGHYLPVEDRVEYKSVKDLFPVDVNFGAISVVQHQFYIGTKNHGLYVYDPVGEQVRHVDIEARIITNLYADGNGHLCVSTDGNGAYLLDATTAQVLRHFHAQGEGPDNLLLTNAVYHYYLDRHGNHWFCQYRYGLAYTYHQTPLFQPYSLGDFSTEGFDVRSFLLDGHRRLIGTHDGMYVADEATGQTRRYSSRDLGGGHIVTSILRYGSHYYVATYDGGLHTLDTATMVMTPARELNALMGNSPVLTLKRGPGNRLWIGYDSGVAMIDSTGLSHQFTRDNSGLNSGYVYGITFTPDSCVWLCSSRGLSIMSADGSFLPADSYPDGFFQHEKNLAMSVQHQGLAYFGNRNGIFYTDTQMEHFGRLPLPDDLIGEECYYLYTDSRNHLWISTAEGFTRVSSDLSQIQHFGAGEGLNSMLVSRNGVVCKNDTLWVASASGLLRLSLDSLESWQQHTGYRVMLYDILRGEHPVEKAQGKAVNEDRAITLRWNFSSQTFRTKVFLNDFAKPEGRLFEYRLDDEEGWHLLHHDESLTLNRLSVGSHTLTVRLAGTPGTQTDYEIRVMPNALFYVEMSLLLIALLLLVIGWRFRKTTRLLLQERDQIEDVLVEMQHEASVMADEQDNTAEEIGKYQQLRMSDEECADVVSRMRQYLETERAYTNPDLKRADLAQVLHVPAAKLSYVFSMYLNENYYEFINRYRLEAFKQMVAQGDYKRFTITALSEQCGFKKSSFFSTFRKVEGMTPAEYLKHKNITIKL